MRYILLSIESSCAQAKGWSVQVTEHREREGARLENRNLLPSHLLCRSKAPGGLAYAQDGGLGHGQLRAVALPSRNSWFFQLCYERSWGRFSDLYRLTTLTSGGAAFGPRLVAWPPLMAGVRKPHSQKQCHRKTVDRHRLLTT